MNTKLGRDSCQKCIQNTYATHGHGECKTKDISWKIYSISYAFISVLCFGIALNLSLVVFFGYSPINLLNVVYQMQIYMLIPLMNIDVSEELINFYRTLSNMLGSFFFLSKDSNFFGNSWRFEKHHFDQPSWYLYLMGFESGSSVINLQYFLWFLTIYTFVISCLSPIYALLKILKWDNRVVNFIKKVCEISIFRIYIRLFFFSFVFILIS